MTDTEDFLAPCPDCGSKRTVTLDGTPYLHECQFQQCRIITELKVERDALRTALAGLGSAVVMGSREDVTARLLAARAALDLKS